MTDYSISIPEELYEKAQKLAQETTESVDAYIVKRLERAIQDSRFALAEDEEAELKALAYLSNEALWTIAREQMPSKSQNEMQALMEENNFGTISETAYQRLESLVEQSQRLTLRKSEAMKLLVKRGIAVRLEDLDPEND